MLGLEELDKEFRKEEFVPNSLEAMYFFFLENGLSLSDIDELPIPYLWNCLRTKMYYTEKAKQKERQ